MMKNLILLTIFSLPLYVIRFKIFGLPTTVLEVLIVTTVIYWLYNYLKSPNPLLRALGAFKHPLNTASIIFLLITFGSVLIGPNAIGSFGIYRAYFLEPWLLFIVILNTPNLKTEDILKSLLYSGFLVALFAILQFITGKAFFPDAVHELEVGRAASFFNSANAVSLYLAPIVTLILGIWVKNRQLNWLQILSLFIFLFTIIISRSAGALIGLLLVFGFYLVYFLLKRWEKFQNLLLKILPLGLGFLLLFFTIFLFNISLFTPKTGLIYPRPFDNTRIIRLCLWEGTRDLLQDNFIFGTGINNFPKMYSSYRTCDTELFQYPHNLFLTFWTETGIIGLGSFLFLVWIFYAKIIKSHLPNVVKLGLIGYLIYLFIHGMVDVPYFKNDLSAQFWVFLAFGLLTIRKYEATDR